MKNLIISPVAAYKVVKIVCVQPINAGALITEVESEADFRPRQRQVSMIQSQEMNPTRQYSFRSQGVQHARYYI